MATRYCPRSISHPFLSVVTRCHPNRPRMLARNKASLTQQSSKSWEQVFLADKHGYGVAGANKAISDNANVCNGDYVLILDDDDMLAQLDAVEKLESAAVDRPDVVVFRADHSEPLGVLPDARVWGKRPMFGGIGSCSFITRRDIYESCAHAFNQPIGGDYWFLEEIWMGEPTVVWLDEVLARTQRISWGAGE